MKIKKRTDYIKKLNSVIIDNMNRVEEMLKTNEVAQKIESMLC